MQTLNQFIKLLQDYANSHYQINDFGFGDVWELVESFQNDDASINDAREYPVMWVEPTGSSISENELLDNYTVYFADRVLKGERNEKEVLSDMKLLCLDLASYLQNAGINDDYNVVKQFSLDDFTEKFQDEVSGYSITIQIKQSFNYNECAIPYSGVTEQDNSCAPVTITDGETITEVASGGAYTCQSGGVSTYTYDVYFDGVDTGQDVTVDGTNITINLS